MADTVLLVLNSDESRRRADEVLRDHAYHVVCVEDGSAAMSSYHAHSPVAVVLDDRLQGTSGLEVCRRLRAVSDVPVVMLTGGHDEVDELLAFAVGADDCLARPFSATRLAARVDALVRRQSGAGLRAVGDTLGFGPILIRLSSRSVTVHETQIDLTRTEFELLCLLVERPDQVVSRSDLMQKVWGTWHGDDHVVEVHLSRLRHKVRQAGGPRVAEPVRGVGYRLGTWSPRTH